MKHFLRNNSLSLVLFAIFFATIIGMSFAGLATANNEAEDHNARTETYVEYVASGDFIEGVFENWESEFLQMFALVFLTIYLRQKGSDESKPLRGKMPQDTKPRYSFKNATNTDEYWRALRHAVYSHSLSLSLLAIFIASFLLHAFGGAMAYNEEALRHGQETLSTFGYIGTSQFWYESLQNWQSEFFAVGSLILMSIHLRERGSPESKPVGVSYNHTTG